MLALQNKHHLANSVPVEFLRFFDAAAGSALGDARLPGSWRELEDLLRDLIGATEKWCVILRFKREKNVECPCCCYMQSCPSLLTNVARCRCICTSCREWIRRPGVANCLICHADVLNETGKSVMAEVRKEFG